MKSIIMKRNVFILSLLSLLFVQYGCNTTGKFTRTYDQDFNELNFTYKTPSVSFYKDIKNNGDTTYLTEFHFLNKGWYRLGSIKGVIHDATAILYFSNDSCKINGDLNYEFTRTGSTKYTFYCFGKDVVEKLSTQKLIAFKLHIYKKRLKRKKMVFYSAKKILISNK